MIRVPRHWEHNWFTVTSWADEDWQDALARYWQIIGKDQGDPRRVEEAEQHIKHARADYRRRVLSWARELVFPLKPGEECPTRVAELLAEAWDVGERPFDVPYGEARP